MSTVPPGDREVEGRVSMSSGSLTGLERNEGFVVDAAGTKMALVVEGSLPSRRRGEVESVRLNRGRHWPTFGFSRATLRKACITSTFDETTEGTSVLQYLHT